MDSTLETSFTPRPCRSWTLGRHTSTKAPVMQLRTVPEMLFMMTSFSVMISRIMKTGIIMNITVTGFTR
jgi:hypothetical protein